MIQTRKEISRRYYANHKKECAAATKKYRIAHPEIYRDANRKHYKNNPIKCNASSKKYADTMRGRFSITRTSAKCRKLAFDISFEKFSDLLSRPCFYCGRSMRVGLDRVNNSIGYVYGNVVPCCVRCNKAKSDMPAAEFFGLCLMIVRNHAKLFSEKVRMSEVPKIFRNCGFQ